MAYKWRINEFAQTLPPCALPLLPLQQQPFFPATQHRRIKTGPYTAGSKANTRYSNLSQVDTGNVFQLSQAWTFHTGDADSTTQIQVNPLIVDGILYGVSPKLKLFALDAATGN